MCSKTIKELCTCTKGALVKLFKTSLKEFMQHVCNIKHQYRVLDCIKNNLSGTQVILHMDFSENYVLKYASEVQSSHFGASKKQVSLHTSVAYYSNDPSPVSYGTFSNSLRHDPAAICAHLTPILNDIKRRIHNLESIHFISDGPVTQYRNKTMFYLTPAYLSQVLGVENKFWHSVKQAMRKERPTV